MQLPLCRYSKLTSLSPSIKLESSYGFCWHSLLKRWGRESQAHLSVWSDMAKHRLFGWLWLVAKAMCATQSQQIQVTAKNLYAVDTGPACESLISIENETRLNQQPLLLLSNSNSLVCTMSLKIAVTGSMQYCWKSSRKDTYTFLQRDDSQFSL